jgi:hypothetical protein
MSSNATYNRRGAKARRTTKPSAGGASSADFHQSDHQKSPQDHIPRRKQEGNRNNSLERPARSWAETVRESPARQQAIAPYNSQTYHTVIKDPGFVYPFATQPRLLLTGCYSGSDDKKRDSIWTSLTGGSGSNEGTTSTSPYKGACRHKKKARHEPALHGRTMGHGYGCYKISDQGDWTTTGDIYVRFSSTRAAATAYEQQRSQHQNRDTKAERLLSYTC